jgi:hypothetical protein
MQRINHDNALAVILYRLVYSLSRFRANPATGAHVPIFQALRDQWTPVQAEEIAIQEELSYAQALVDEADDAVDDFCGRFSKAVLVITKDDASHPLYILYFGGKSLSEFRAPKLNAQLRAMKAWVDPLQKTPHPALAAMVPELITLLDQADKAVAAKGLAQQHRREFRTVGARRQFVDTLNATRAQAHGELAKMPFLTPGLPPDYAERFFPQEPAAEEPEPDTIASVTARISEQEKTLAADRVLLEKLQGDAVEAAKVEAERRQDEEALAAIEQQKQDLAKQEAALREKLGKK